MKIKEVYIHIGIQFREGNANKEAIGEYCDNRNIILTADHYFIDATIKEEIIRCAEDLIEVLNARIGKSTFSWEKAVEHFYTVKHRYLNLQSDYTTVANPVPALMIVFKPIEERYLKGERTPELYKEMMDVE